MVNIFIRQGVIWPPILSCSLSYNSGMPLGCFCHYQIRSGSQFTQRWLNVPASVGCTFRARGSGSLFPHRRFTPRPSRGGRENWLVSLKASRKAAQGRPYPDQRGRHGSSVPGGAGILLASLIPLTVLTGRVRTSLGVSGGERGNNTSTLSLYPRNNIGVLSMSEHTL